LRVITKNFIALTVICLTIIALWYTNWVPTPKDVSWEDVVSESKTGGYQLIKTDDLRKKQTEDPDKILIVDTRQEWEFRTGHIRQAVNFPMEPTWLSRWQNKGALENFLGPDKDRAIVFY
jgi:3-mercaptopyruvate sulfurtransferase SseA